MERIAWIQNRDGKRESALPGKDRIPSSVLTRTHGAPAGFDTGCPLLSLSLQVPMPPPPPRRRGRFCSVPRLCTEQRLCLDLARPPEHADAAATFDARTTTADWDDVLGWPGCGPETPRPFSVLRFPARGARCGSRKSIFSALHRHSCPRLQVSAEWRALAFAWPLQSVDANGDAGCWMPVDAECTPLRWALWAS
jgi:hypothetical protein